MLSLSLNLLFFFVGREPNLQASNNNFPKPHIRWKIVDAQDIVNLFKRACVWWAILKEVWRLLSSFISSFLYDTKAFVRRQLFRKHDKDSKGRCILYKNWQRIRFVSQGRHKVTEAPVCTRYGSDRKENTSDFSAGTRKTLRTNCLIG